MGAGKVGRKCLEARLKEKESVCVWIKGSKKGRTDDKGEQRGDARGNEIQLFGSGKKRRERVGKEIGKERGGWFNSGATKATLKKGKNGS